ncbi:hypothetical protein BDZ97DRAFT_1669336 [Flammula alnicola]|nr:hypothetical protein BDZ97DRAFT_1669336 [Flammula alnicola]
MPGLHLFLSANDPWNARYHIEEGQVIYKAESTGLARHVTILRAVPRVTGDTDDMRDNFSHLAHIAFQTFCSSRIRYREQELCVNELFKKKGWSFYGRNRIFTGPDGREYVWKMGARVCKVMSIHCHTRIKDFHRRRLGILKKARPASLEIFEEGVHMVDFIVVTFIYMEKVRADRERAADSA